jgi:hypothetical protein
MAIWSILRTFSIIYGHMVNLSVIWHIFPRFGKYYRRKSGNPATVPCKVLSHLKGKKSCNVDLNVVKLKWAFLDWAQDFILGRWEFPFLIFQGVFSLLLLFLFLLCCRYRVGQSEVLIEKRNADWKIGSDANETRVSQMVQGGLVSPRDSSWGFLNYHPMCSQAGLDPTTY